MTASSAGPPPGASTPGAEPSDAPAATNAVTLVIADLHLDAGRPAVTALALRFLEAARGAGALWIIGDLFEAWLGDDVVAPAHEPVADALAAVSASGTALHLMHGNRDFLLGEAFARRVGATLHREDEHVLTLGTVAGGGASAVTDAERCVLLHGDTLCTGDVDYQRLRTVLRDAAWRDDFLARSPAERIEAAQALRRTSREAVAGKSGGIMDVESAAVSEAFARTGCRTMVHGHTHRPADHRDPDGRRRVVVGDWHDDHARYARHDGTTLSLETWR